MTKGEGGTIRPKCRELVCRASFGLGILRRRLSVSSVSVLTGPVIFIISPAAKIHGANEPRLLVLFGELADGGRLESVAQTVRPLPSAPLTRRRSLSDK